MSGAHAPTDLEERKLALEEDIRKREMALKERESNRVGLTTAQTAIAAALISLASGAIGAGITSYYSRDAALGVEDIRVRGTLELEKARQEAVAKLETRKFETSLVFEAIKTPSRADAIRNLKFFVAAGFISDDGKIASLPDEKLPSLNPSSASSGRALRAVGLLTISFNDGVERTCTAAAISSKQIATSTLCVSPPTGQAPITLNFRIGARDYAVHLMPDSTTASTALLNVADADGVSSFLDSSRIRPAKTSERVYLAIASKNEANARLEVCNVLSVDAASASFKHSCATGAGSAGALVIGVEDDALLGIHYSRSVSRNGEPEAGVALFISADVIERTIRPSAR